MTKSDFLIRLAGFDDVDALTDLHCASFTPQEHVPVMLGKRYVHATYRWLVSSDMTYVLVADADGQIVGLVAVADRSFTGLMFKACLKEFVHSIADNPSLLLNLDLWRRLFRRPDVSKQGRYMADYPGMAQMTIGAVDSNYRGQAIFPTLVEATRHHSKIRGSRAIRAGIYKSNMPSRRVFIKSGWVETRVLETSDTVFYVAYLDLSLPDELGFHVAEEMPE
jgi:hypothetical protein